MSDDDLTPLDDEPLLKALRAPGQAHELAGEDAALAMFRQSIPARRRRRQALTRAGVTGAGIVLGLGLTGGVAAAYTTGLPDPVQDAVHSVIEPLPIPAPPTAHVLRVRHRLAVAHQRELAHARAEATPTRQPTPKASDRPTPTPRVLPPPTTNGTQPPASPAPSPTATPVRPTMTVAVSQHRVPVHSQVVLSGRLSRGDTAVPGRIVYAAELAAGESSWRRVGKGTTASDGTISLTVPALTTNVRLRLVTGQGGVTSPQTPVVVVPKLTGSATRSGNQRVETVTADGGQPGDVVRLLRRDGTSWTWVASTTLDGASTAQFTVPGRGASRVRYVVRLAATKRHAASMVEFVVPAR